MHRTGRWWRSRSGGAQHEIAPDLYGGPVSVLPDQPAFVIEDAPSPEGVVAFPDGFEFADPAELFLEGSEEAFHDIVALGCADDGGAGPDAGEGEVLPKMPAPLSGAVVVSEAGAARAPSGARPPRSATARARTPADDRRRRSSGGIPHSDRIRVMPNPLFQKGDSEGRSGPAHGGDLRQRKDRPSGGLRTASREASRRRVRSPTIAFGLRTSAALIVTICGNRRDRPRSARKSTGRMACAA